MVGTLSLVGSSGCTEAAILAAVFALLLLPSQRRGGPLAAAAGAEWGRRWAAGAGLRGEGQGTARVNGSGEHIVRIECCSGSLAGRAERLLRAPRLGARAPLSTCWST